MTPLFKEESLLDYWKPLKGLNERQHEAGKLRHVFSGFDMITHNLIQWYILHYCPQNTGFELLSYTYQPTYLYEGGIIEEDVEGVPDLFTRQAVQWSASQDLNFSVKEQHMHL